MELNHLKYFYFVAKEGGFSKASRVLKIAQPSITKTVKTLEASLDVKLFERDGRGVQLTKRGSDLFRKCEIIFDQVDRILADDGSPSTTKVKGSLSICAAEPIASYILPAVLKPFLANFPEVYPQILSTTAAEAVRLLAQKKIDFALLFHAPDLPDTIKIVKTYPLAFKLVVAQDKRKSESVCSSFIGSREVDNVANKVYPTLSKLRKVYPKAAITVSSNSLTAHKNMVLNGLGVSILPEFLIRHEIQTGELATLLSDEAFVFQLKLIQRSQGKPTLTAMAFIERFTTVIGHF